MLSDAITDERDEDDHVPNMVRGEPIAKLPIASLEMVPIRQSHIIEL
jgi:hypothetical protein